MDTKFELNLNESKFVIFLDIVGFKNLIIDNNDKKDENEKLIIPLNTMFFAIENALAKINKESISHIIVSDSIVLIFDKQDIETVFELLNSFIGIFMASGLLIKGGMSYGRLYNKKNYWGLPVIESVQLEENLKAPTISCTEKAYNELDENHQNLFRKCDNDMLKNTEKIYYYYDIFQPFLENYGSVTSAIDITVGCICEGYKKATKEEHKYKWEWAKERVVNTLILNAKCLNEALSKETKCSSLTDEKNIDNYLNIIKSIFDFIE